MVEHPLWSELVVPLGFADGIALMARDDGFAAIISIPVALGETRSYDDPLLYRVRRHLQAAVLGIRRRPLGAKEVIADTSGRVLHEGTDGCGTDRRELLRAAARAYDAERRGLVGDPDAERVWRELWRGGWAVVEAVDTDGKRMLLLRRDPSNPRIHALDAREQWALKLLVRGAGYKGIAFDLGVGVSGASKIVAQALRKLGFKSCTEFVRYMSQEHAPLPRTMARV